MSVLNMQEHTAIASEAEAWLADLERVVRAGDRRDFDELFLDESYWRDIVSMTWDTCQFWGRDAIRDAIFTHATPAGFTNLHLDDERSAPRMAEFL
ncbi:MAG: hypothetical protein WCE76_22775, partial [Mycobacterium sp.]